MQGSSRAAMAASRDAFTGVLAGEADPATLAEQLFAVVGVIDENATLRRALADPSREGAEKAELATRLFDGKISPGAVDVVKNVASQRWSSERDLSDALESFAVESVVASAEKNDRADQVEDELFRFGRLVAADSELRGALTDAAVPADKRVALVNQLLEVKVAHETLDLARQAVRAPRGRRFDRTIEHYLDTAAHRREQQTATVYSAVALDDADKQRLAAGLASIYGGKVRVNVVVNPEVLGGIRVEIGDEVIDGTVLRKLESARKGLGG